MKSKTCKKEKEKKNGRTMVLMYHGAVKATQGHSGTQLKRKKKKKKRKRRASLPVSVIKLGTKLECVCGVFCLTPPFTSPSVNTFVRYDWRSERVRLKEPGAFICEELKD